MKKILGIHLKGVDNISQEHCNNRPSRGHSWNKTLLTKVLTKNMYIPAAGLLKKNDIGNITYRPEEWLIHGNLVVMRQQVV